MDTTYDDERSPAMGAVVEVDRGSLPFALVHGDSLVACAAWALGAAGVAAVALGTPWSDLVEAEEPLVLHDPLCPMTPAAFIAECLATAVAEDEVVVAVEEGSGTVLSPVVLPASVVGRLDALPSTDFDELARLLAADPVAAVVRRVVAPADARRVASTDDVRRLEADTRPAAPAADLS